jgi:hypothetical protein
LEKLTSRELCTVHWRNGYKELKENQAGSTRFWLKILLYDGKGLQRFLDQHLLVG